MTRLETESHDLFKSGMTALCLYDARCCADGLLDLAADHELLAGPEKLLAKTA